MAGLLGPAHAAAAPPQAHNVVLLVLEGLRAGVVRPALTPALAALRDEGVAFADAHALVPATAAVNAAALATGRRPSSLDAPSPPDADTVMRSARAAGYATAAAGRDAWVFDPAAGDGPAAALLDERTGSAAGVPLAPWLRAGLTAAGLPDEAPPDGPERQAWFAAAFTRAILPGLRADGRPFFAVLRSGEPGDTQASQRDGPGSLRPGINGPTALAALRRADATVGAVRTALAGLGLSATTDLLVTADRGATTIARDSDTSPAAKAGGAGMLPTGFLALDLAGLLGRPLFDPDAGEASVAEGRHPRLGNGLIGADPARPDAVVRANGSTDTILLPGGDRALAQRIVAFLSEQDYVSGLFAAEALGPLPGTLPLGAVGLGGGPLPAILVNFASFGTGCALPGLCAAALADTPLEQGQGGAGGLSRADTAIFAAAVGPDFKTGYVDPAPSSTADMAQTVAAILRLPPPERGLSGRRLAEAMPGGLPPPVGAERLVSQPGAGGLVTLVDTQRAGGVLYIDAAGFPGRTVGLRPFD